MNAPIPIFDGHNDTLLRLTADRNPGDNFFESPHGHIDMSRARRGGLAGGFFAVYIPADPTADIRNIRKLELVMKEGAVIDVAALPTVR